MQAIFSLNDAAQQLVSFLSLKQFGINVLDIIVVLVILFYAYEGYLVGFALASIDFGSFVISFLLGLLLFDNLSPLLVSLFSLPQGFASAISFFLIALVSEICFSLLFRRLLRRIPELADKHPLARFLKAVNHPLGILPGLASAYIILSFLLTIIIALPSSPLLKQLVTTSSLGSALVSHTASIQRSLNRIFGGAVQDTLNVLTIKPQSDETVSLNFTVETPTIDEASEEVMFQFINQEREKRGLAKLNFATDLREVARSHASDMLKRGYFSHITPEGLSPFDRMDRAGIVYTQAGENLALSPTVQLANTGLINSPGHRANILSPKYKKVGVGVMDGGIYGKMFVQEFTD